MMRRIALVLCLVLPLSGLVLEAKEKQIAKGQFDLYLNGVKKGYEKFKIEVNKRKGEEKFSSELRFQLPMQKTRRNYVDVYLYPEITLALDSGEFLGYEYRLGYNDFSKVDIAEVEDTAKNVIDQDWRMLDPMNMSAKATEDEMESRVDLGVNAGRLDRAGGTLHFKQTKLSSTRVKDENWAPGLAVLDAYSFCLYLPLARRALAMEGGSLPLTLAFPQGMKLKKGSVEYLGTAKTPFRGKTIILKHFEVLLGGSLHSSFWVDKSGSVVQVSVPAEGILAVLAKREPLPFDREAPRVESQEVLAPALFEEEEVSIAADGAALAGALVLPKGAGPFPVVLLVPDLAPSDRDGNPPGDILRRASPLKQFALFLAENGFACLRTDARGIGRSGGSLEKASQGQRAADIALLTNWLKGRKEIRPGGVAVLAFGLGGWTAARAADVSKPAAFIGVGFPAKELLRLWKEQVGLMGDPAERQQRYVELDALSESLKGQAEWGSYQSRKAYLPELRELSAVNPGEAAASLSVPSLFAYPDRSQVVLAFHAEVLKPALKSGQEVALLPGAGHFLQGVDEEGSPSAFLSKPACEPIVKWLKGVLAISPPA